MRKTGSRFRRFNAGCAEAWRRWPFPSAHPDETGGKGQPMRWRSIPRLGGGFIPAATIIRRRARGEEQMSAGSTLVGFEVQGRQGAGVPTASTASSCRGSPTNLGDAKKLAHIRGPPRTKADAGKARRRNRISEASFAFRRARTSRHDLSSGSHRPPLEKGGRTEGTNSESRSGRLHHSLFATPHRPITSGRTLQAGRHVDADL